MPPRILAPIPVPLLALPIALALGGCDAAIAGYFMPGVVPGVGRPIRGKIVDGATQLPVGGATVTAGLGSTVSDAKGEFALYGSLGSREISVARGGYLSQTLGGITLSPDEPVDMTIQPLFPDRKPIPSRFVTLQGRFDGLPAGANGRVSLGGKQTTVQNGLYNMEFSAGVPGRIMSSVLAWGTTDAPYIDGVLAPQPFHYTNFQYVVDNFPMAETVPASIIAKPLTLPPTTQLPIQETPVRYGNVTSNIQAVLTDVALDFGVVGFVPVARGSSSSQGLALPVAQGLKYAISGEAVDSTGRGFSRVTLTTNRPDEAAFPLLPIPKIESPANGATDVGPRPTFRWSAVPGNVRYQVTLKIVDENDEKWVGVTDTNEITFPGFSAADTNNGALRAGQKCTWTLVAIDALEEDELPSNARKYTLGFELMGPVPVQPYRLRQRESSVEGYGFTI